MGTTTSKPEAEQWEGGRKPEGVAAEPATFTCEICIEPVPASQKFRNNTPLCSHPFCTECVTKYITVHVTENSSSDVSCPSPTCHVTLDPLTCRPHLPPTVFAKWCDNLCEKTVLGLDRCYCPNRDCSAVVLSECGGVVRRATCPRCRIEFCFRCGVNWHAGYSCDETAGVVRDDNDVAFGVLAEARRWRRCPRCRHCVELIEGCSIVKCRCGTNFCYKCGSKVKQHWCDCDRNMMWRVVCVRIFITTVIFLQFIFLFGAVYKLVH